MTLIERIKQALKSRQKDELLKNMGYSNLSTGEHTLNALMKSGSVANWLGGESHYDMHYGSEGFLVRLLEELGMYDREARGEIDVVRERQLEIARMQTPYIYIDTHFRRNSEPIFALAMMEGKRRITLDKKELADLTLEEVLETVSQIVREHFLTSGGKLPLWGKVHAYLYHHTDGSRYLFDTAGNCIEGAEETSESKATLKLGNQDITNIIGEVE